MLSIGRAGACVFVGSEVLRVRWTSGGGVEGSMLGMVGWKVVLGIVGWKVVLAAAELLFV